MADGFRSPVFLWIGQGLGDTATACAGPYNYNPAYFPSTGDWQVRYRPVIWYLNGVALPIPAAELRLSGANNSAPDTLSGDRVITVNLEAGGNSDGTSRPGRIADEPRKIELTFPRLPNDFFLRLHNLRAFPRPFPALIHVFDTLDRETLNTTDGQYYYTAVGNWQAGTWRAYLNGALLTGGTPTVQFNRTLGYLRFDTPLDPVNDKVEMTYVWGPMVTIQGQIEPDHKASTHRNPATAPRHARPMNPQVKLTLRELRGPGLLEMLTPDAGYYDGFTRADGALGNLETGQPWTQTEWVVGAHRGLIPAASGSKLTMVTTDSADGYIETTVFGDPSHAYPGSTGGWTAGPGLFMRYASASSYFVLHVQPDGLEFGYWNGATYARIGTPYELGYRNLKDGDRIGVNMVGNRFDIYINRVKIDSATDSRNLTAMIHGILGVS